MSLEKHSVVGLEEGIRERRTLFGRPDRLDDPLYVITTVFNAPRWRSRWRLYEDFAKHVAEAGAKLITVEVAFGRRHFAVTQPNDPFDVQLRTDTEIWFKERCLNIGFQHLVTRIDPKAKYIAWVDADVHFANSDWADRARHELQHFNFCQMWSQYQDLTPDGELIGTAHSFADNYNKYGYHPPHHNCGYEYPYGKRGYPGAPGLAWCARRDALDHVGGLLDICILGAADWYMAHAMIGRLTDVLRPQYNKVYKSMMREWEARCDWLYKNSKLGMMGVIPGLALHHWHGPKKARKYGTRDQILIDCDYNPALDLKTDVQGLYQLTNRSPKLRDGIWRYFRERNEDSIDL